MLSLLSVLEKSTIAEDAGSELPFAFSRPSGGAVESWIYRDPIEGVISLSA